MSQSQKPLLPGAVVGVIGGGQLGRYFVIEARRLGYSTWVLDPDPAAPAMQMAENTIVAVYDDADALQKLAEVCDAVTIEFENVPAASLELVAKHARVAPAQNAVSIAQDRHLEKQTAQQSGLTTAPYGLIESADDIEQAVSAVAFPAILKTARLGYDGKGQQTCHSIDDVRRAFGEMNDVACVLEQRINLQCELSVVLARGADGQCQCFPVAENVHKNGILETSCVPAGASADVLEQAQQLAVEFAKALDYQGVLAIEFFVDDQQHIIFNEMAPRPHNSGHYTLDATVTSQFEQQLRALCALPLGSVELLSPVCMLNVLGDCWPEKEIPAWAAVVAQSGAHLHLYSKAAARPGRKMGHINCLSSDASNAKSTAEALRTRLHAHL